MIDAALAEFWAVTQHINPDWIGPGWAGPELVVRGLTTVFLMVLFLQVNARALPVQNLDVKINHFLVPVLMLGILAHFSACLIDQYIGPLNRKIRLVVIIHVALVPRHTLTRPFCSISQAVISVLK